MGIFNKRVKKFKASHESHIKIPQIGWNNAYNFKGKLFEKISEKTFMYFVHSYYVELGTDTAATTNYINEYSSALQKNNFYAAQFHPEKSAKAGEQLLKNFIEL